ncbi:MAG: helix-turn-helix transcriptional regulator [Sphingomonadales bacterium]|nr:helix-turn-helix transcriptional regulator [Sphingomonadales bacterium]
MPSSIFTQRHQAFIAFIASTRKGAGVTQAELAARLGKPQSFVSKVERGERRLDVIEFCEVAEALGYGPAKLLEGFVDPARGQCVP